MTKRYFSYYKVTYLSFAVLPSFTLIFSLCPLLLSLTILTILVELDEEQAAFVFQSYPDLICFFFLKLIILSNTQNYRGEGHRLTMTRVEIHDSESFTPLLMAFTTPFQ